MESGGALNLNLYSCRGGLTIIWCTLEILCLWLYALRLVRTHKHRATCTKLYLHVGSGGRLHFFRTCRNIDVHVRKVAPHDAVCSPFAMKTDFAIHFLNQSSPRASMKGIRLSTKSFYSHI